MSLTIGGVAFLISILVILIKNCHSFEKEFQAMFLFSIITGILLDVGYVGKIGEFEILFNYVASVITFVISLGVIIKHHGDYSMTIWMSLFVLEVITGIALTLIFSKTYQTVTFQDSWDTVFAKSITPSNIGVQFSQLTIMLGRIILFFLNLTAFKLSCNRLWVFKSFNFFYKIGWLIILLSIVELILDNAVSASLFREFIYTIFGKSESTYDIPRQVGGIYVPLLTAREPSKIGIVYFAFALNSIFILERRRYKLTTIVYFFLMVLFLASGGALSSIIYLLALIFSLIFVSKNKMIAISFCIILSIPAGLVVFSLFGSRITDLLTNFSLFSKGIQYLPVNSEIVRMYSIYNNLKLFLHSPILGIGLGIGYSFSGLVTTLTNIGIAGLFIWIGALFSSVLKLKFKRSSLIFGIVVYLFTFSLVNHMGEMTYQDKSFFIFICLCSLNPKEKRLFTISKYLNRKLAVFSLSEGKQNIDKKTSMML